MGFFDSFFGKSQRRDLEAGKASADAALRAGYDEALGFSDRGLAESNRITQPYMDQGGRAFNLFADTYGVNGEGARNAAFGLFKSDPFNAHSDDLTKNALYGLMKKYNAGGMANSGASNLGLARAGLEATDRRIADWRGGLGQLGNTGVGLAEGQANRTYGTGQFNAGLRSGLGQQLAGNAISFSNAMAQSRNTGWNNALGLLGTMGQAATGAAKAYTAFSDRRLKRNVERVGELPSGLPVYDFQYLWSDDLYRGVMADEARQVFPEVVSVNDDGFLMVDYSRIA